MTIALCLCFLILGLVLGPVSNRCYSPPPVLVSPRRFVFGFEAEFDGYRLTACNDPLYGHVHLAA